MSTGPIGQRLVAGAGKWDWAVGFALASLSLAVALGAGRLALLNRTSAATLWFLAAALALLSGTVLLPRVLARSRRPALESLQLFRITGLGLVFTLLVSVLAVAALNNGNNLLFVVVAMMLASYLVSGTLARLALTGLAVDCVFPDRIHAGSPAVFRCLFRNERRWLPAFSVTARLVFRAEDGSEQCVEEFLPFLPAGGRRSIPLRHQFQHRGAYTFACVRLVSSFPFGFFQRGCTLRTGQELLVFPQIRPVREFQGLPASHQGELAGMRKGQGEGLHRIREYVRGDRQRDIHWYSSAKTGRLMVREFVRAEQAPLRLFLDNSGLHPRFEEALVAAASLAVHFHGQGADVDVVCRDRRSGGGGSRDRRLLAALETLARVRPAEEAKDCWGWIEPYLEAQMEGSFWILLTGAGDASVPVPMSAGACVVRFDRL